MDQSRIQELRKRDATNGLTKYSLTIHFEVLVPPKDRTENKYQTYIREAMNLASSKQQIEITMTFDDGVLLSTPIIFMTVALIPGMFSFKLIF